MSLEGGPPVASVGEREIDYAIAQLLMTSPQFSQWLVAQTVSEQEGELAESIDVVTNTSYAGEGESDIEFGFLTQSGERHVLLIENKIDATTQPNQLERYYSRGQIRVDREDWDAFTVCLLAPQSYLSPDDETAVDSIVQYEAVQSKLDDLSHDGTPFFQALFEAALTKSTTVDASPTIATIENRMHAQTELPLRTAFAGKKRISFQSTHPRHPDAVWYDCFIGAVGNTGRTTVRLHIESIDGLTDDRRDSLETVISQHTEALPDYEWHFHRKANLDVLRDVLGESIEVRAVIVVNIGVRSHPDRIDDAVDDPPAAGFQPLFRRQQNFASERVDCLVALDAPELRVAESLVPEAGDEKPLQRSRPSLKFHQSVLVGLPSVFATDRRLIW